MRRLTKSPDRFAALASLFQRAGEGKRVFGYDSLTGRGGELHPAGRCVVPGTGPTEQMAAMKRIDRACVEGDLHWVILPPHVDR